MAQHQTLTIELSNEERDRLETLAKKLNVTPEAYLYQLLKPQLEQTPPQASPRQVLHNLRAIGQRMPPVDAVQLVRQERDRLAEKGLPNP
jgi:predicted DNA-binding protein